MAKSLAFAESRQDPVDVALDFAAAVKLDPLMPWRKEEVELRHYLAPLYEGFHKWGCPKMDGL